MVWGIEIAGYLFLAGLGAGAYATAAWLAWKRPKAKKAIRIGRLIAPIVVAIGLVLLMVDASAGFHHPLRFFLLVTNLSSVMSWGVIILSVFMVVSLAGLIIDLTGKSNPRWLDVVGSVFAFSVAAYTGVLLGASPAFPLWNPMLLPILFVVSAASTGSAIVTLITLLVARDEALLLGSLQKLHQILPVAELVLIAALLLATNGVAGSSASAIAEAGAASVAGLLTGSYAVAFWIGLVVIGLLLPFGMEMWGHGTHKRALTPNAPLNTSEVDGAIAQGIPWMPISAEIAVLIGGFVLRVLIVLAAVPIS